MKYSGKTVAVTGAASGIGAALCREFLSRDCQSVAAIDLNSQRLSGLEAEIGVHGFECDVSSEAQMRSVLRQISDELGDIDIFCSNAGIHRMDADIQSVASASNADFSDCFNVNVMPHVYAVRELLPKMTSRGSGHFMFTVSAAGLLTATGSTPYSVSKYAAQGFVDSLAISLDGSGVSVSSICPEGVVSDMTKSAGLTEEDGLLSAEYVAKLSLDEMERGTYLILPHPNVAQYFQNRAQDYGTWIEKMGYVRRRTFGLTGAKAND